MSKVGLKATTATNGRCYCACFTDKYTEAVTYVSTYALAATFFANRR